MSDRRPTEQRADGLQKETVMKRMLVALAIALVPLTVAPALALTKAEPSEVQLSVAAWPTICFEFAFWKYCI
jgi:hypothetical protein